MSCVEVSGRPGMLTDREKNLSEDLPGRAGRFELQRRVSIASNQVKVTIQPRLRGSEEQRKHWEDDHYAQKSMEFDSRFCHLYSSAYASFAQVGEHRRKIQFPWVSDL